MVIGSFELKSVCVRTAYRADRKRWRDRERERKGKRVPKVLVELSFEIAITESFCTTMKSYVDVNLNNGDNNKRMTFIYEIYSHCKTSFK